MKYVFFGTPEFASIILKGLIGAGMPPVAVVCNPDKPVGRKKLVTAPLTKQIAKENGISVFQPETKKDLIALSPSLAKIADFAVVAAYAKIIPQEVIDLFKLGIIGVHPSLLPKFRGPSPIQSAILSDELKTGTTLFLLAKGVDDNFGVGRIESTPQDTNQATFTTFFERDAGLVEEDDLKKAMNGDATKSLRIWRMVRALNPEPGVYVFINNKRTKLLSVNLDNSRLVLERIQKEGKNPEALTQT